MTYVLDEERALFASLNAIPKRASHTEYSCRADARSYPPLMRRWLDAIANLGLDQGASFDLDFHIIPFHGKHALVEKHYVSKRRRKQKGILAFVVQDASARVFCSGNADVRKDDQNDDIFNFIDYWRERNGHLPRNSKEHE